MSALTTSTLVTAPHLIGYRETGQEVTKKSTLKEDTPGTFRKSHHLDKLPTSSEEREGDVIIRHVIAHEHCQAIPLSIYPNRKA
jgi:hypothetical protein